ncbi:Zn-dependent hydrolase [Desulfofustis glycolicus]|uniref:Allantoate deiminase n=1 Tax=Desulfofustis glycolicus DSM 9705 TaxID=1121409 RepID=A0A1M5YNY1_9BACT|nr:Zn-dependent hydrolase [Desulfofustis glycolicus]SHI13835.1 allantoate deiminase [Desulfofustis glycolicus DSM 9705]
MDINFERIQNDLKTINSFNDTPGHGITRFSFSKNDQKCRAYITRELAKLGIIARTDNIGNLRATWNPNNTNKKSIVVGSHTDTVKYGGQFDGLYGVVSALEVFRCLVDNHIPSAYPLEFIIFVEEEGSNFGCTTLGSKALTGMLNLDDLKTLTDKNNTSFYDYLLAGGLSPELIDKDIIKPGEIAQMLELHIEQSFFLEEEKAQIGIVENVAGIKTLQVSIIGESNHAGSTPMHKRRDPLIAASIAIQEIETIAKQSRYPTTVATVGYLDVIPNAANIIAEQILFTIDIRDVIQGGIDITAERIEVMLKEVCTKRNLTVQTKLIAQGPCVKLSQPTIDVIKACAEERAIDYRLMNSGAVHDSAIIGAGTGAPANLIFVPSRGGKSHCPEEYTSTEDLHIGSQILLDTLLKLLEN